jgi:hypothetical protein
VASLTGAGSVARKVDIDIHEQKRLAPKAMR